VATNDRDADAQNEHPMAEKGGCLNLGWGCLPVIAVVLMLPVGYFF
jgi:hypothetical protein